MGSKRPKPERLAAKLLLIRQKTDGGLSQGEMLKYLEMEDEFDRERISKYERGLLEPPWFVLIKYAEIANVWLEVLVKDELDLPEHLPSTTKNEGIKRISFDSQ